jgi:hypothetical protein
MTDNLQLQTTRLTNASGGNLLDTAIADIENAISVLFGITKDSVIDPPMSIAADGNVTMLGDLTLAGAPSAALHCSTKKYVDDNPGPGGSAYICWLRNSLQTVSAGTGANVSWTAAYVEDGDAGQWDSGDPTKLVCKSAGDYLIIGRACVDEISVTGPYTGNFDLRVNGAAIITEIVNQYMGASTPDQFFFCFGVMRTLAEDDYIQLYCDNSNGSNDVEVYGSRLGFVKMS